MTVSPLQLVAVGIDCILWVASNDLARWLYVSPGYERAWGTACARALEVPRIDAVHPGDRVRVTERWQSTPGTFEDEYRIVRPDGEVRWIAERGHPIRDDANAISHYVGVSRDVTLTRLAERETERFLDAARAANDGLWDWNIAEDNVWWSEAFYDKFGFERSIPPSHARWLARLHPEDHDRVVASFQVALERGDASWSGEYRFVKAGGAVRHMLDRAFIRYDATGKPLRMSGALIDVTAHRALEAQLRHAQKMEAVGQLAGGIAHDFNNILQAVDLELQHLARGPLPTAADDAIRRVLSATERAASLTRQLLVFSRPDVASPKRHGLDHAIAEVAQLLRRVLGEQVVLRLLLGATEAYVHVDRGMLDQVVTNLALNARDAMPDGGTVTLSTAVVAHPAQPGSFACIQVRDTGHGIARDVLPRIFEPFFTTKEPGRGTGLGLAMVSRIVEHHRGWIEVESDAGAGTTFRTYLPLDERPPENEAIAAPSGGSETVLLVEDDDHVRHAVRDLLEHHGYRVLEADCGASALAIWDREHGRIDLVLTDVVMPGALDGPRLVAELAARQPALRVLFMTGHDRNLALPRQYRVVHKPVDGDDLLAAVRASLDGTAD